MRPPRLRWTRAIFGASAVLAVHAQNTTVTTPAVPTAPSPSAPPPPLPVNTTLSLGCGVQSVEFLLPASGAATCHRLVATPSFGTVQLVCNRTMTRRPLAVEERVCSAGPAVLLYAVDQALSNQTATPGWTDTFSFAMDGGCQNNSAATQPPLVEQFTVTRSEKYATPLDIYAYAPRGGNATATATTPPTYDVYGQINLPPGSAISKPTLILNPRQPANDPAACIAKPGDQGTQLVTSHVFPNGTVVLSVPASIPPQLRNCSCVTYNFDYRAEQQPGVNATAVSPMDGSVVLHLLPSTLPVNSTTPSSDPDSDSDSDLPAPGGAIIAGGNNTGSATNTGTSEDGGTGGETAQSTKSWILFSSLVGASAVLLGGALYASRKQHNPRIPDADADGIDLELPPITPTAEGSSYWSPLYDLTSSATDDEGGHLWRTPVPASMGAAPVDVLMPHRSGPLAAIR